MGALRKITDIPSLINKTVLLRIDTNVEIDNGEITDDTRLYVCKKTIDFILEKGGNIVIIGHLGRPEGKNVPELSLLPIAAWFAKEYNGGVSKTTIGDFEGWEITSRITLLENIRFFQEDEKNDREFSQKLGLLGNYFVNDAFGVSHRAHASVVGVTEFLSSYAGFWLIQEIENLTKVLENPERPLTVIIGGAKIETKLPVVSKMCSVADTILVGGKIAFENEILKNELVKIHDNKSEVIIATLNSDKTDISPESLKIFIEKINSSKTVVWNGPVGLIRKKKERNEGIETEAGTKSIAQAVTESSAYTILGGGDTLSYLSGLGLLGKFSFVSTGGGAMLEFLSGKELPGIKVLNQ